MHGWRLLQKLQGEQNRADGWVHTFTPEGNECPGGAVVILVHCDLRYNLVSYRLSSKFRRIVINIRDSDDGCGCVGEAVHGVALRVSGLNDQCVLRHFLKEEKWDNSQLNCKLYREDFPRLLDKTDFILTSDPNTKRWWDNGGNDYQSCIECAQLKWN